MHMSVLLLTIINSLLMATGQVLWKIGMSNQDVTTFAQLLKMLYSPFIIMGLVVYAFTTLLWLYILNKADISYAYPIQSLVFVYILIISVLLFHEQVPLNRWLGVGIICFGVYVTSMK